MTQTWTNRVGLLSLSAMLIGSTVPAEAGSDRRSSMQQNEGQSQNQNQRSSNWQKVKGTVKNIKNVGLRNKDQDNLLVQVQTTDQGRRQIVDLGDAEALDIDIQKGDQITAWGQHMKFGDKQVFIAHKLKANGEQTSIEHPDLSSQDSQGRHHAARQQKGRQSQDSQGGDQPYSGQSRIRGEIVAAGEVTEFERAGDILAFDRDHFYIVQEPNGRQTHMLVTESLDQGFSVGDQIEARVKPDGTVKAISRTSDSSSGDSQSQARSREKQSRSSQDQMARQSGEAEEGY